MDGADHSIARLGFSVSLIDGQFRSALAAGNASGADTHFNHAQKPFALAAPHYSSRLVMTRPVGILLTPLDPDKSHPGFQANVAMSPIAPASLIRATQPLALPGQKRKYCLYTKGLRRRPKIA